MKILVDITHPAHVHFFRHAINEWKKHGHQVQIVARDKDLALPLLQEYGYAYTCLSRARKGMTGLALELIEHQSRLSKIVKRYRPGVMLNVGGTFIVHVGKLFGIRTIVFSDTETATLSNRITYPFASVLCTPSCYQDDWGKKQVRYEGYQELAYTHPNWFIPNPAILDEVGLRPGENLFMVRFVGWGAGHDIRQRGFSLEGKRRLVKMLGEKGRVIITSESMLPPDLEPYQMRVSPTRIHDLLAYSSLYVGEGATMASEAAMLGIPSIYVNTLTAGTLEELEQRFGLVRRIVDERQVIESAVKLASEPNMRREYQRKRQRLLEEKIDVTAWMVDFVERYPESLRENQR